MFTLQGCWVTSLHIHEREVCDNCHQIPQAHYHIKKTQGVPYQYCFRCCPLCCPQKSKVNN